MNAVFIIIVQATPFSLSAVSLPSSSSHPYLLFLFLLRWLALLFHPPITGHWDEPPPDSSSLIFSALTSPSLPSVEHGSSCCSLCLVFRFLFLSISLGYKNKVLSPVLGSELKDCVALGGRLSLSLIPPSPSLSFHLILHTVQFGMSTYNTIELSTRSNWDRSSRALLFAIRVVWIKIDKSPIIARQNGNSPLGVVQGNSKV